MSKAINELLNSSSKMLRSVCEDWNDDEYEDNDFSLEEIELFLQTLPAVTDTQIKDNDEYLKEEGLGDRRIVFGCAYSKEDAENKIGEENYIYIKDNNEKIMEGPNGVDPFNTLDELASIIAGYYGSLNEGLNEGDKALTTQEFVDWHDGEGGRNAKGETLEKIYNIFLDNGSTEDEDVDIAYEALSEEDKIRITDIIKNENQTLQERGFPAHIIGVTEDNKEFYLKSYYSYREAINDAKELGANKTKILDLGERQTKNPIPVFTKLIVKNYDKEVWSTDEPVKEDLNSNESYPEKEHFPENEEEFYDMFEEAMHNVLQLRTNGKEDVMLAAMDMEGIDLTYDEYLEIKDANSDTASLEDYIDNVFSNVADSGAYDEAEEDVVDEDLNSEERIEVQLGNKKVIGIVDDNIDPEDYDTIKGGQNFAQAIKQCIKDHLEQEEELKIYAQLYGDEGSIDDFEDISKEEVYDDFLAAMESDPESFEPDSFYATDTATDTIDGR